MASSLFQYFHSITLLKPDTLQLTLSVSKSVSCLKHFTLDINALFDPSFVLCQVALQKVYNFATSNIFETCVSGRMVADMCRAAAKVRLRVWLLNMMKALQGHI